MRHARAAVRAGQPLDRQGFVWPLSRKHHGTAANDRQIADAGGKDVLEKDADQLLEQKSPAEQIGVLQRRARQVRLQRLQKPVVGVDVHRAQERVRPRYMAEGRIRRPTLAEEEQRGTIGFNGPDLRLEPADLDLTGSVGDRDDAVGGAEIHADCNRNHSKTPSSQLMRKELYRCGPLHAKGISRTELVLETDRTGANAKAGGSAKERAAIASPSPAARVRPSSRFAGLAVLASRPCTGLRDATREGLFRSRNGERTVQ